MQTFPFHFANVFVESCMLMAFLNFCKVAKEELSRECDYELEAVNQKRFRDMLQGGGTKIQDIYNRVERRRFKETS